MTGRQPSKPYVEIAEAYRLLLMNGFPVREQLVQWAEKELSQSVNADIFLSEITTSSSLHLNDLISLLQRYVGNELPLVSSRVLIGYLADNFAKGYLPLEKVCDSLCRLDRQGCLTHEEKSIIAGLDDELQLAGNGIKGSVDELASYVNRLLLLYCEFRLQYPETWADVNTSTEYQIKELYQTIREERSAFIHEERKSQKRQWWKFW